ncbi:MAG: phosphoglycerate kinase, partial [Candidatus Omnitrophica bacterium]|nr:phosphoglycerate kinase [Candidatus Omnitrophota bacterium]MBU1807964.1 phosphoglycerate kinase [Candidatus Omnitrophota bacterium]
MGRTKPLFSLGSTQVVGQKEIALYPLVDENYYEASRLLDLAAEASISNGIRSKNPKAPATPTLKAPAPIVVKEKLNIKDIPDAYWKGKRVVLRADLNVPLKPFDDSRIQAEIPNIKYLLERGARVILSSHLGKTGEGKLLVEQVHPRLEELLGQKVIMGPVEGKTVAGDEAKRLADGLKDGEVLLLENLRLYAEDGEEANDPRFAERLAALGDIFVYDAYGTAHRSHASTVGITNYLTSVAGLLLTKEIDNLKYTIDPERPNAVIMGGAKISDKIEVINALLEKMDVIMIGGGMANTFLKAYKNTNVQSSLVDDKSLIIARYLIEEAKRRGKEILLPVDVIAASKFTKDEKETVDTKVIDLEKGETLPEGWTILDIGPRTIENYKNKLRGARIVIWNGPVGYAEHPQFRAGTYELAKLLINEQLNTRVIVGGGDSIAVFSKAVEEGVISQQNIDRDNVLLSTGGGATLEFLAKGTLPAINALTSKAVGKARFGETDKAISLGKTLFTPDGRRFIARKDAEAPVAKNDLRTLSAGTWREALENLEWKEIRDGNGVVFESLLTQVGDVRLATPLHVVKKFSDPVMFNTHLVVSLLDEHFVQAGNYTTSHVPAPLIDVKGGYVYIYAEGREGFNWSFIVQDKENGVERQHIELEEWNTFNALFAALDMPVGRDITTPEDMNVSQNIIEQDTGVDHFAEKRPKNWMWIDVAGMGSLAINRNEKLRQFIIDNGGDIANSIGENKYNLLKMLVSAGPSTEESLETFRRSLDEMISERLKDELLQTYGKTSLLTASSGYPVEKPAAIEEKEIEKDIATASGRGPGVGTTENGHVQETALAAHVLLSSPDTDTAYRQRVVHELVYALMRYSEQLSPEEYIDVRTMKFIISVLDGTRKPEYAPIIAVLTQYSDQIDQTNLPGALKEALLATESETGLNLTTSDEDMKRIERKQMINEQLVSAQSIIPAAIIEAAASKELLCKVSSHIMISPFSNKRAGRELPVM